MVDTKESRAGHCKNGRNEYICISCAEKYCDAVIADRIINVHNNTCYICEEHKLVATSRKLLGFTPKGQ